MKTIPGFLFACALELAALGASAREPKVVSSVAITPRDGFTRSGSEVRFTRNGVAQTVEKEVVLENGLRVRADGSVTLPNGTKTELHNNQLLTLQGAFESVALTSDGLAPITTSGPPVREAGAETERDGISVGPDGVMVTRGGASTRLSTELRLSDGTRVRPDGRIIRPDGSAVRLRANQALNFDGTLLNLSVRPDGTNP